MVRGTRVGALVAVLLATLLIAVPTATADHPRPPIHTPAPAPGSLVESGTTVLSAWVRGMDVTEATWELDGQPRPGGTIGPVQGTVGQPVTNTVDVTAGVHEVALTVTDGTTSLSRTWQFAATDRRASRLAGDGRVETAVTISQARFARGGAGAAVLARADDFADALAGAPLAFHLDAPLLLSDRDALPEVVRTELRRVLPEGGTVHLLGGEQSLTPAVRQAVVDLGYDVERHAGVDRYETAVAIARRMPPSPSVMVASGQTFPDALAASVPASRDGTAVLLTRAGDLPEPVARFVAGRDVETAFVVGGTNTVGEAVADHLRRSVGIVDRIAGDTRFDTAVAVAEQFFGPSTGVSLASGVSFPDALTGTGDAAARGQPLLLTDTGLPGATAGHLRTSRPTAIVVYGGPNTVADVVVRAAIGAAEDGPTAPGVLAVSPSGTTVPFLDAVTVTLTEPVGPGTSVHLEIGGREVDGSIHHDGDTVTFVPGDHEPFAGLDVTHAARLVVAAVDGDGRTGRHEAAFAYLVPDPLFATVGGVDLLLPSRHVEMIGFHESNHDGARQLAPFDTATPMLTLPSRGRGTGSRSAADIVAAPDQAITAPVTGTVTRAGTYRLYCDHYDHFVVIEPDAHPGWEVKLLHFVGLQVSKGQRVVARQTVLGTGPRTLPFESQVDEYSHPRNWPHVHLEVVDPSIPDRPGSGC